EDLIGQEAMVRTVSNAFETGRIPQAWILTGVRGVGKTTTARILARALNYELADGSIKSPTIHMPTLGVHCQAIMESRHMDVLEMDAASHTGVDDVRQINDSVRYAPASARYKVYIIDEVHMLSTAAFNAFLKTLGLADRTRVIDLFDSLARGDIANAFKEFREQYDTGADPIVVLSDLAEFVNFVTRVKIVPATADNVAFGETERLRARDFAAKLSMRVLSRMWQMLLKGITETQSATR